MPKFKPADAETRRQTARKSYQAGPAAFILKRGLLGCALPMFVVFTLYDYFIIGYHNAVSKPALERSALICVIAGLTVGGLMWLSVAKRVHQRSREG